MQKLKDAFPTLLVVLIFLSCFPASHRALAASVMQLDVCNKHKDVSTLPAMSLTVKVCNYSSIAAMVKDVQRQ